MKRVFKRFKGVKTKDLKMYTWSFAKKCLLFSDNLNRRLCPVEAIHWWFRSLFFCLPQYHTHPCWSSLLYCVKSNSVCILIKEKWWKTNMSLNMFVCVRGGVHQISSVTRLVNVSTLSCSATPTNMCECSAQLSAIVFLDLNLPVSPAQSKIFMSCQDRKEMREEGSEHRREGRQWGTVGIL